MSETLAQGLTLRYTKRGMPVIRLHYSADPDRNPATEKGAAWYEAERKKYTSEGAWQREQEIKHEAGGGELVLADILAKYAGKIIITDPSWKPSAHWRRLGGFDHGKTNPTGLLDIRVDFEGTIYICGEYYMPGLTPLQHRAVWQKMWPDVYDIEQTFADPTIFDETQAQADGKYKSISQLYKEESQNGEPPLDSLLPAPKRDELLGIERLLAHWHNLDQREPTVKIVCRMDSSVRQHGLYQNDCPNLLWELRRTRREKLSAQQLMTRNPSEKIVDKDNHLRDCLKYALLALPAPADKPLDMQIRERLKGMDMTSAMIRYPNVLHELGQLNTDQPVSMGRRGTTLLRKR